MRCRAARYAFRSMLESGAAWLDAATRLRRRHTLPECAALTTTPRGAGWRVEPWRTKFELMMTDLPLPLVDSIVNRALAEDLGSGDITTEACIDADAIAVAHGVARGAIVACGAPVVARVFARIDPRLDVTIDTADGSRVSRGAILWRVKGSARSVLMGERVALNFAQRMSGIATVTRSYVNAVPEGAKTRITDTRKTTPASACSSATLSAPEGERTIATISAAPS